MYLLACMSRSVMIDEGLRPSHADDLMDSTTPFFFLLSFPHVAVHIPPSWLHTLFPIHIVWEKISIAYLLSSDIIYSCMYDLYLHDHCYLHSATREITNSFIILSALLPQVPPYWILQEILSDILALCHHRSLFICPLGYFGKIKETREKTRTTTSKKAKRSTLIEITAVASVVCPIPCLESRA